MKLNPRKVRLSGLSIALFATLTRSLSSLREERRDVRHHSFAGTLAANVDVAVIGVTDKCMASAREFLIELVEHRNSTEAERAGRPAVRHLPSGIRDHR